MGGALRCLLALRAKPQPVLIAPPYVEPERPQPRSAVVFTGTAMPPVRAGMRPNIELATVGHSPPYELQDRHGYTALRGRTETGGDGH